MALSRISGIGVWSFRGVKRQVDTGKNGEHERDSAFGPVTPVAVVCAWLSSLVTPN